MVKLTLPEMHIHILILGSNNGTDQVNMGPIMYFNI